MFHSRYNRLSQVLGSLRVGSSISQKPFTKGNLYRLKSGPQSDRISSGHPHTRIAIRSFSSTETLVGEVKNIIFRNGTNNYSVATFQVQGSYKNPIKIVGIMPNLKVKGKMKVEGEWIKTDKHGDQFKVKSAKVKMGESKEHAKYEDAADHQAIVTFLSDNKCGVSLNLAGRIVDHFGADTKNVIDKTPHRLLEVAGIGKTRIKSLKEAWDNDSEHRDLYLELAQYADVLTLRIRELLIEKYGAKIITMIKTDPYETFLQIEGLRVGFERIDQMVLDLNIVSKDSLQRRSAIISHLLSKAALGGHTAIPYEAITNKHLEWFRTHGMSSKLKWFQENLFCHDETTLEDTMATLCDQDRLKITKQGNKDYVQLPAIAHAEHDIASSVRLVQYSPASIKEVSLSTIKSISQEALKFSLDEFQVLAMQSSLQRKLSVLTGGPGTGKTTLLKGLVSVLKAQGATILLAAPTGKAAHKLGTMTGEEAQTIHRLLKYAPDGRGFAHGQHNKLRADFIIIDEMSMVDTFLASSLMRAIPSKCHILLVGDVDQLPCIGPGSVLTDMISSHMVSHKRLQVNFRQAQQSSVIEYARRVNRGDFKLSMKLHTRVSDLRNDEDFQFLQVSEIDSIPKILSSICTDFARRELQLDLFRDVQVLSPQKRGVGGVYNLNKELQKALNNDSTDQSYECMKLDGSSRIFKKGDKVIQTGNNYAEGVFNGNIGTITSISKENVHVAFEDKKGVVRYASGGQDASEVAGNLELAYALTVHKSQGSEYELVIVVVSMDHYFMLKRSLLYTAMTRGKKVIIVGDTKAYTTAVRNNSTSVRFTTLKERLDKKD